MAHSRNDQPQPAGKTTPEAHTVQDSFLRQVLDINPNLIFAKDREGRFTLVNQTIADIYGTTVHDLLGKTDADFNPNPDQVKFFRQMDLQVMDTLQELLIPEEVLTDADGKRHWLQTVKRPIVGPDGKANQVLGVATDITQRRELEEQLRHAQKLEAIGQLAGGIAHDFNNMLAVILGNAERILTKYKSQTGADRSLLESLELIQSAGSRAADLVNQLLTFSRKNPVMPVVLNLGAVVSTLNELLQTLASEKVTVAIHRKDSEANIRIDRGRLEQLIVNLVVNARDAMAKGGEVTIETSILSGTGAKKPIAQNAEPRVRLTVSDTGVGIPPELVDRIFEPFFSTKGRGKGTGLGLSIVYGIVQQAGGQITVQSKPGVGSKFCVDFPAVSDPITPTDHGRDCVDFQGCETVLVCEDEADVLRLIKQILEDNGYHVLTACDGNDAIRRAADFGGKIDLLLTDVVMPGLTGRQLADAIRTDRPDIKVMYITGYSANLLSSLGDLQASHQVITKPFQAASLMQSVRCVLDSNTVR